MEAPNILYRLASLLLQVPVLAILLVLALIWHGVMPAQDLSWIAATLVHFSLLPLVYGAFVYRTKRISDSEIMTRRERIIPFFIVTVIYGAYLLETTVFNAPAIFKTLATHFFITALAVSMLTVFWKVSVHAAGITQFVALLTLLIGNQALFLFPLILLTGWLRIKMKSHDTWQVIGGILVALIGVYIAMRISPI